MSSSIPHLILNTNDKLPIVGLGTSKTTKEKLESAVVHALECGYRHFDSAMIYPLEGVLGQVLSNQMRNGKVKRSELFLTSKLWLNYNDPDKVRDGLMTCMKSLQVDYLDLCLVHFPITCVEKEKGDKSYPYTDNDYVNTWRAMIKLKDEGLVRNIGVSNFNQFQLNRILNETSTVPAVNQIELHPYNTQTNLVEFCQRHGVAVVGHTPLGCFASPHRQVDRNMLEDPTLIEIASRLKRSPAQVALRFQIQRKVCVIPKSVTPSRIEENLNLFDFALTADDMDRISSLNQDLVIADWSPATTFFNDHDISAHKFYPFRKNYSEPPHL